MSTSWEALFRSSGLMNVSHDTNQPYTSGLFDNLSLTSWPQFDMDEAFDIVPIGHWVWLHCRGWQPFRQLIVQPCYSKHVQDRKINKVSIYHQSTHHALPIIDQTAWYKRSFFYYYIIKSETPQSYSGSSSGNNECSIGNSIVVSRVRRTSGLFLNHEFKTHISPIKPFIS